jgi:hypothetical protein
VWVPCAGTVTPWETHLGSEEYEPDAKAFYAGPNVDNKVSDFLRYFGEYVDPATITPTQAMDKGFFPYRYGYPWETKVSADFTETTTKLYAHGRMSYELSYVMPDKKTVYETDDGQNVGFFKFVADTEGDLTEGVNYCAKFTQTSDAGSAAIDFTADVTWIEMPQASASQVEAAIETETFDTLFEVDVCYSYSDGFHDELIKDSSQNQHESASESHHDLLVSERRASPNPSGTGGWINCLKPAEVTCNGVCCATNNDLGTGLFHGKISDGSGDNDYQVNLDCTWTIASTDDSEINLIFGWALGDDYQPDAQVGDTNYNVDPALNGKKVEGENGYEDYNDYVKVFSCPTPECNTGVVVTTKNAASTGFDSRTSKYFKVEFRSDGGGSTAAGFDARWYVDRPEFRPTNTGKGCECLKPKTANKQHLAATLEKRRYAGRLVCSIDRCEARDALA